MDLTVRTTPMDTNRHEKVVRKTDLDALSLRHCANFQGYFSKYDPYINDLIGLYKSYLQYSEGYTLLLAARTVRAAFDGKKLPIINRGTYLRTIAIDDIISRFLDSHRGGAQIVLLGGGLDTRVFHLLKTHANLVYHELDFLEQVKIKRLAIDGNPELRQVVDAPKLPSIPRNREEWGTYDGDLHTERYHLVGMDVRELVGDGFYNIDDSLPTLVISECMLCYVKPDEAEGIIKYWMKSLSSVEFVIYEPVLLGDAFGETMARNLAQRGINMEGFSKYATPKARREWLERMAMVDVEVHDIAQIGGLTGENSWIPLSEMSRINRLELVDEVEEIIMLYQHYLVCTGKYQR